MLHRLDLRGVAQPAAGLPRPTGAQSRPLDDVQVILDDVRARGDAALGDLADRFDGGAPDAWRVPAAELEAALERVPAELRTSLEAAADRIRDFHGSPTVPPDIFERDGMTVRAVRQAVDRAGCYAPGGRGSYPSTVLMTVIPARMAGVAEVVLCTPPGDNRRVADATLAAAALAQVDEVYAVGGVGAIAALAYGTESVRPVDVIVGPGNSYVATAKQLVAGEVGVPSAFAGPSEIVVIADDSAVPGHVAIDLMVQAEHGPDGLAWLVTWQPELIDAVELELTTMVAAAARREDIEATLASNGYAVVVDGPDAAVEVSNRIAPEHLQLMTAQPDQLVAGVRHAGAVFVGPLAPASLGDYIAGPSHVLPTHGTARFSGALSTDDFVKHFHVIDVSRPGFDAVADHVEVLATAEGFEAHAQSIRLRR